MTSLTTAGSILLQELAGRPLDPHAAHDSDDVQGRIEGATRQRPAPVITTAVLAALARINDRTLSALAGKQRAQGPDSKEG